MTAITLESLGISREEILNRVVDRLCREATRAIVSDPDGDEVVVPTRLACSWEDHTRAAIDEAVERIAQTHIMPRINQQIEDVILQRTNDWGRPVEKGMSFTEYLVHRAETFMTEKVDTNGKTQSEDPYSWRSAGPRLAVMIDKYINSTLTLAIGKALADANTKIGAALKEAVSTALAEVVGKVKVEVKTR